MHELISQNKVVLSKRYSIGSAFIIEMSNGMFAVLGFTSKEEEPIYSRAFFYDERFESSKKEVLKQARNCFKQVKECFLQNKIDMLETLD